MVDQTNPFSLIRASDITDAQINSLWVELGPAIIGAVIEPTSPTSKYILGGKGSGKTHLLRYHSYQVARLRNPKASGLDAVKKMGYLAVFLRATALDAARFEIPGEPPLRWQTLFGIYLELRLAELVIDALMEIKRTSPSSHFNDQEFIGVLSSHVDNEEVSHCNSLQDLKSWAESERRTIDQAINNAAFSGELKIHVPFSVGAFCLPIKQAICAWSDDLKDVPLIYMLDEIENFSEGQQIVVNSLIHYGEGLATFRVSGRLYAIKTMATIGGEENREGSEFQIKRLDDALMNNLKFKDFARQFVRKRIGFGAQRVRGGGQFDPELSLQTIDSSLFFEDILPVVGIDSVNFEYIERFEELLRSSFSNSVAWGGDAVTDIVKLLTKNYPLILSKLNILLFCKKYRVDVKPIKLANEIAQQARDFISRGGAGKSGYANAYGHYKIDLFAQICKEAKGGIGVPYAGFDAFVHMARGNPRNLLIILGRLYEMAAFRNLDFTSGTPISIPLQTTAAADSARFMFERDTNYGKPSDDAREVVERLASLLRTARFALKIPEVSPLTVSFSSTDLSENSKRNLDLSLKYSFLFEVDEGRPDRNSDRINRKVHVNPMLSPRWGLPIARRGDISLNADLLNSIFDVEQGKLFDQLLKLLAIKWNNPFAFSSNSGLQGGLFGDD